MADGKRNNTTQTTRHTRPHVPFGAAKRKAFLDKLRNTGNVRAACTAADIYRSTAYEAKAQDAAFAAAWQDALDEAIDLLEAKAWNNAMQKDSETSLWNLLKAHRPDKYRETTKQEHSGEVVIKVVYDAKPGSPPAGAA